MVSQVGSDLVPPLIVNDNNIRVMSRYTTLFHQFTWLILDFI